MKKCLIGIMVIIFIAITALGFADGGPPGPPDREGIRLIPPRFGFPLGMHPEFAGRLTLSKEQMEKLDELRKRTDKEVRELEYKLAHKCLEMQELFANPKASEATLLETEKELSSLSERLHSRKAIAMIKMRSVLTADQIGKLNQRPPPPHWAFMRDMEDDPCSCNE